MTDQSRPGRKRSEQSRLAILTATLDLVAEAGYGALTVEGIAARSGVGKQTIYRWWPSKADVLLDALATKADLYVPIPDEGTFRADLAAFLGSTFELGEKAQVADTLRALMAQAQIDPGFGKRFREDFLNRRREALGTLVDRARERGELPAEVSSRTVIDVVFGTLWYRLLATREPIGTRPGRGTGGATGRSRRLDRRNPVARHRSVEDLRRLLVRRPGPAEALEVRIGLPALVHGHPAGVEQVGTQRVLQAAGCLPREADGLAAALEVGVPAFGGDPQPARDDDHGAIRSGLIVSSSRVWSRPPHHGYGPPR